MIETEADVRIEPAATAQACVIWLHGLGADGHDFVPVVPELQLPSKLAVRFIFPHAPVRPVTLNNGLPMRAWFDITGLNREGLGDRRGMEQTRLRIDQLIEEQADTGIPAGRIVVAGFSQGGAVALHVGLRQTRPLAGLLPLSTYLPFAETVAEDAHPANAQTPILLCHGTYDPVLPVGLGVSARDRLLALGYPVSWREYSMQHQVCMEQIMEIGRWLTQRLDLDQLSSR